MTYTKSYLEELVRTSYSVMEVMRKAGIKLSGGNHRHWARMIRVSHNIDTSHFNPNKRQADESRVKPDTLLKLKEPGSSKVRTSFLRRAMLEAGISYRCKCGNDGHWQGEELVLEIDHINQNPIDDRKENLQFICSNCHTQKCKREYAVRRKPKPPVKPADWARRPRPERRKVEWPSKEELQQLVWTMPLDHLAKRYGVSGVTVKVWCQKQGVEKPPRAYWLKRSCGMSHEEALKPTVKRPPHVRKLTAEIAAKIREGIADGRGLRQLARDYGCCYGTVYAIKTNRLYKVAAPPS